MKKLRFCHLILAQLMFTIPFNAQAKPWADPDITNIMELARTMHCEAGVDGVAGMLLVADSVRNRVESKCFPDTILDNVHRPWAYECRTRGVNVDMRSWTFVKAAVLARKHILGQTPRMTYGTHYVRRDTDIWWRDKLTYLGSIKSHDVYKGC